MSRIEDIKETMWYAVERESADDILLAALLLAKECAEVMIDYMVTK